MERRDQQIQFVCFPASETVEGPGEKASKQDDTARIIASIARGTPVLAFRVVGPSDYCIITGYDEGGEVLLGWSTYQDIPDDHNIPHDPTGYFRKPGWHDNRFTLDERIAHGLRETRAKLEAEGRLP